MAFSLCSGVHSSVQGVGLPGQAQGLQGANSVQEGQGCMGTPCTGGWHKLVGPGGALSPRPLLGGRPSGLGVAGHLHGAGRGLMVTRSVAQRSQAAAATQALSPGDPVFLLQTRAAVSETRPLHRVLQARRDACDNVTSTL